MSEISLDDDFKELKAFMKREYHREKQHYESNNNLLQRHYVRITQRFGATIPLQELKLLEVQCIQILTILDGANNNLCPMYHYVTELNQHAVEIREKYIKGFSKLYESIKATINYKKLRLKGDNSAFEDYLILGDAPKKEKLVVFLYNRYTNSNPKSIFLMLIALQDLGIVSKDISLKQTSLYKALSKTFGNIGTRQAYNKWFSSMAKGTKSDEEEEIKSVKRVIETILRGSN
jgi:hypothetical protein